MYPIMYVGPFFQNKAQKATFGPKKHTAACVFFSILFVLPMKIIGNDSLLEN